MAWALNPGRPARRANSLYSDLFVQYDNGMRFYGRGMWGGVKFFARGDPLAQVWRSESTNSYFWFYRGDKAVRDGAGRCGS